MENVKIMKSVLEIQKPIKKREDMAHKKNEAKQEVISCKCGNSFPAKKWAKERKCYGCETLYEKIDNKWLPAEMPTEKPITKDTYTISHFLKDHGIRIRK